MRRKLAFATIVMTMIFVFGACGGNSNLMNNWEVVTGPNSGARMELSSGGEGMWIDTWGDPFPITSWSTSDSRLTIHSLNRHGDEELLLGIFDFDISGDTLTLITVGNNGWFENNYVLTLRR